MAILKPSKEMVAEFKRVYVGGHHEVYCNGYTHVRLRGGSVGSAPTSKEMGEAFEIDLSSCDCGKWKKE